MERLARHLGLYDRFKATSAAAEMLRADSDATLADRGRAVLAAAAAGDIPMTQAGQLISALGALGNLIDFEDWERRLAALEASRPAS